MNKNFSIAVKIKRISDSKAKQKYVATYPMKAIFKQNYNQEEFSDLLKQYESDYEKLVSDITLYFKKIHSKSKRVGKVVLYWSIGDKIVNFLDKYKDSVIFPDSLTKTLSRDAGVSDKIILRCRRFRLLYKDVSKIDKRRSFNSYVGEFEKGYLSRQRKGKI